MPAPAVAYRRLTPLRNIGIRFIKGRTLTQAHAGTPGTPSIQWASCVFERPKPEEPTPPRMVLYTATPAGGFKILVAEMVNFNDPCK